MVDFCNGHADDAGVTCRERKELRERLLFCMVLTCQIHVNIQLVRVVLSDLLMELFHMKVVWRSVGTVPGEQFVMISGQRKMLGWLADGLGSLQSVC